MVYAGAAQAAAVLTFLAPAISASKVVSCYSGINGLGASGVKCTGPQDMPVSEVSITIDYSTPLNAAFVQMGVDATVNGEICPLATEPCDTAPGGVVLLNGAKEAFKHTDGYKNAHTGPHAASVTYSWPLENTTLAFAGYMDGLGNYDLCTVTVEGDHEDEVSCEC